MRFASGQVLVWLRRRDSFYSALPAIITGLMLIQLFSIALAAPDVLASLEAFIAAQEKKDSIAKAANSLLRDILTKLGLIPFREVPEGEDDPDG